jgi:hypothetical protein
MKKDFFIQEYTHKQLNDFVEKIASESGYIDVVEKILREEVKFSIIEETFVEKDGRIYFDVVTTGLKPSKMLSNLLDGTGEDYEWLYNMLLSQDIYDKRRLSGVYGYNHIYEPGLLLKVILVKAGEIDDPEQRTVENLKKLVHSTNKVRLELLFLILKKFTTKKFREMGINSLSLFHYGIYKDPIRWDTNENFIYVSMEGNYPSLKTTSNYFDNTKLDEDTFFAFVIND